MIPRAFIRNCFWQVQDATTLLFPGASSVLRWVDRKVTDWLAVEGLSLEQVLVNAEAETEVWEPATTTQCLRCGDVQTPNHKCLRDSPVSPRSVTGAGRPTEVEDPPPPSVGQAPTFEDIAVPLIREAIVRHEYEAVMFGACRDWNETATEIARVLETALLQHDAATKGETA